MGAICACLNCAPAEGVFPRKHGVKVSRTITDKSCCIIWWVFLTFMILAIASGILYGDGLNNVKRLTHGSDWDGNICGVSPNFEQLKYMMFCGSPQRDGQFPKYIIEGSTVCVASCPTSPTSIRMRCLMPAYHNFTSKPGGQLQTPGGKLVENVETLEMTVTQSVTEQQSYPTEEFGGRFCLPSSENKPLRNLIIHGPWGMYYRPLVSIGGLIDAWPLLVLSALVACLLGWIFIWSLSRCAGPIIFASMCLGATLCLALSLFFLWVIFINTNDASSDYAKFNPIMSVYIGSEAKIYSLLTGMILMIVSVILFILTCTSLNHIDEMVGLIAASMECLESGCGIRMWPVFQCLAFLFLVIVFVFIGLPFVAALGYLDYNNIEINDESIAGLQRIWKKTSFQHATFWYYLIGLLWMLEFYIQFGHYVIAYTVSEWYFQKGQLKPIDHNKMLQKAVNGIGGKHVSVRVGGVDANYGERAGTVMDNGGGKVLVVPVGKKGPGLGRNDMATETFVKPTLPCCAVTKGCLTAFFFHIGSLALGAPIIAIFRIPRLLSQCVSGFLARNGQDGQQGYAALASACLDVTFGKYSKTAYTQIVLSGQTGFLDSAFASAQFMMKAGGSLSYLHGSMFMYEFIATLCITLFCGWMTLLLQKLDIFAEKSSSFYIEDKSVSLIAACLIAFGVAWAWMMMWNQTADVLLYCLSWNRNQISMINQWGPGQDKVEAEETLNMGQYTPQTLRYLIPPYELDPHFEDGLHAHGIGQAGAIMALMEQTAMHTKNNYQTTKMQSQMPGGMQSQMMQTHG